MDFKSVGVDNIASVILCLWRRVSALQHSKATEVLRFTQIGHSRA
ncbi:MAG: hypothetical protein ACJA0N_001490 [Pseudohongiellaceae bacterium]|jgi:hypothetical protein